MAAAVRWYATIIVGGALFMGAWFLVGVMKPEDRAIAGLMVVLLGLSGLLLGSALRAR